MVAGATLILIAATPPESRPPLVRVVIFAAGLIVALRVIGRVAPASPASPDPFDVPRTAPGMPTEIAGLRRIEFDLHMATVHPFGIEWVRPLLRELASGLLLRNRGIHLERDAVAARQVLGEPAWRMIGPEVEQWVAGEMRVSPAQLEAGVTSLEQV
jgi:hypothetical protein